MRRLVLLLLLAAPALGRTIEWKSIDVKARLDSDGNLHVVERQQIVFDGDWNGGERSFNLQGRQSLKLHRLVRVEEGREIRLIRGDVDYVDHFDFTSSDVLRWRSRLPSDPPFQQKELTYVLDYTYTNVLGADEGRFVLWHDFGLPERQGSVERFTLALEFDPVWKVAPVSVTRAKLRPGEGVVVQRDLVHSGGLTPPVYRGGPLFLGAFAAGVALLIILFARAERPTGRFARVEPKLDAGLLALPPEVVGAIWDADIGAPEVAATLARMAQEKKITTRVERKTLHMHLEVSRHDLSGYEARLVDALFFDGDDTDTKRIRKHYASSGIDFVGIIRPRLESALMETVPGWNARRQRFRRVPHVITLVAIAAAMIFLVITGPAEDKGELLVVLTFGGIFGMMACGTAHSNARTISSFWRAFLTPALLFIIPSSFLFLGALRAYPGGRMSMVALIACALWMLAILRLALDLLKITEDPGVTAFRKRALATRKYFASQLRTSQPALRDEWFPYLLAFGLGKHADRWFRAFGGATSGAGSMATYGSSGSSSSSSSSWSGGGGAFGGAGATASWAVAATAIGSGVSAPSSGGGGGSSSSSGGGGGGGW